MKQFPIFLITLFVASACFGAPRISFKTKSHDFGKQQQEQKISYIFEFTNTGNGTLIIEKISAG